MTLANLAATWVVTLVAGVALHPLVLRLLRRRAIMDLPNDRSSHSTATPRGAGVGVALAAGIGLAASSIVCGPPAPGWLAIGILAASYAAAAIGLVDDLHQLPAPYRLGGQVVLSGVSVALIAASSAVPSRLPLAVLILVGGFVLVAFVNAFNFMDGINGISGLNAAFISGYYSWLAWDQHRSGLVLLACTLLAASISFLPWNFPRAVMFLGDVGSYFLGLALGCVAVALWHDGVGALLVAAPLAVYGADTGTTLVRRALAGNRLFDAHREHGYQRLSDRFGHATASWITVAASALCVATSLVTRGAWSPIGLVGVALVCLAYIQASSPAGAKVAET